MTNFQKIMSVNNKREFVDVMLEEYPGLPHQSILKWLDGDYREPILTEELKDYIKHARAIGFYWVAQDGYSGEIFLYTDRPKKNEASNIWNGNCSNFRYDGTLFNALFEKYPGKAFALEDILTGVVR